MRVIAGSARSLRLKTIPGNDTRPTTDRIKETLFNMINDRMYGCRFLDLFSGSGGIGIEALSRGADMAVFVENNRKAAVCINDNLKFTKLDNKAAVMETDVISALKKLDNSGKQFDVIFMDPPYNNMYERMVLEELMESDILTAQTLIIIEASKETDFSYVTDMGYEIVKEKIYKTNKHVFVSRDDN